MSSTRPNVFVVGAPKAGTTSIYHYLSQHPEVFTPRQKELHYFTREHAAASYYRPPVISSEAAYLRHFSPAGGQSAICDVSPSYLYFPQAARRIRDFAPDARIIVLLREPVARTLSHYLMDVSKGYQTRPLRDFLERTEQNSPYYFEYIETSRYAQHVTGYQDVFGADRVLVLLTEEFQRATEQSMRQVLSFLGVDPDVSLQLQERHNVHSMPRFGFVRSLRQVGVAQQVYRCLPGGLQKRVRNWLQVPSRERPTFEEERPLLQELFQGEIEQLARLLNRDLDRVWRTAREPAQV